MIVFVTNLLTTITNLNYTGTSGLLEKIEFRCDKIKV